MQEPYYRGRYILEKNYHECSKCGKEVLQDYAILEEHMRRNHNIDISEYKDALVNDDIHKQPGIPNPIGHTQDTDNVGSLPSGNADLESTPTKSREEDILGDDDGESNQVSLAELATVTDKIHKLLDFLVVV